MSDEKNPPWTYEEAECSMSRSTFKMGASRFRLGMHVFAVLLTLQLMSGTLLADDGVIEASLHEEILKIPMVLDGFWGKKEILLTATVYRPDGAGPFPLIVLSHGNPPNASDRPKIGRYRLIPQVREFIKRGFAVIVPIRRGYGATGGDYAEDYFKCSMPQYHDAGLEAAKDVRATIDYAGRLAYVKPDSILLVGQSAGGFASLAAASQALPGVIGVVNFSGGRGGRPQTSPGEPCSPDRMADTVGRFAKTTNVPVLWHYAENDKYFAPAHVTSWFTAFQQAGGRGRLVMQPPFGMDGHFIFPSSKGVPIWTKEFDRFLEQCGLTPASPKAD
jgi:dienelactone hydrolase